MSKCVSFSSDLVVRKYEYQTFLVEEGAYTGSEVIEMSMVELARAVDEILPLTITQNGSTVNGRTKKVTIIKPMVTDELKAENRKAFSEDLSKDQLMAKARFSDRLIREHSFTHSELINLTLKEMRDALDELSPLTITQASSTATGRSKKVTIIRKSA